MEKLCSKCNTFKNINCFAWRNKIKNILQVYCKKCRQEIDKKVRNKSGFKERKNFNKSKISKRNSLYVINILIKSKCIDCGESDPIILEFDHIKDKKYNISDLVYSGSIKKLQTEIDKCEIRCCNCHRRKSAKQFGWINKFNLLL